MNTKQSTGDNAPKTCEHCHDKLGTIFIEDGLCGIMCPECFALTGCGIGAVLVRTAIYQHASRMVKNERIEGIATPHAYLNSITQLTDELRTLDDVGFWTPERLGILMISATVSTVPSTASRMHDTI